MANIDFTADWQIEDDNGLRNAATLYGIIDDATTLAQIQTVCNAVTPKIAAVVDGATTKVSMTMHFAVVGGNASPVAESNNNEAGNLTFSVNGIKYPFTLNIPNYKDSLAIQGQIANTGATATLTAYLVGGPYTGLQFTDKYLNPLEGFLRGRSTFRGNRKQLARAASGRHNA